MQSMERLTDGMRLWSQWGKQRRFGYPLIKGLPRPNNLHDSFLANKQYIYNVKSLTIQYPKNPKSGGTGMRHFHYFVIPPLKYWNPDVNFQQIKVKSAAPKVTLEMEDGSTKSFEAADLHVRQILSKLLEITNSPRTISYEAPPTSETKL